MTLAKRSQSGEELNKTIQVDWIVRSSPIAQKYFGCLKIAAAKNYMYRRDRFYSFPKSYYTEKRIVENLNRCVDLINSYVSDLIPDRAFLGMSQDYMNHLHTYFEKYRGALLNPSSIYASAPIQIREAFDEFNLMIHRYEDEGYSQRSRGIHIPKMYLTFGLSDTIKRYPLDDEDFQEFTFERNFGSLIVNYCEVGKPLHDVWRDGDESIGHEAVMPLRYYSADAMAVFAPQVSRAESEEMKEEFYKWWDANETRLQALGFTKKDPKNSVGHLLVADLDTECDILRGASNDQVIEILADYQWTSKIECLEG